VVSIHDRLLQNSPDHYDGRMSDVSSGIAPVIAIDRRARRPLPRQVYDGFRSAILRGELRPGQRIPSSRDLARELGISRFPILDAYAQLIAEGYFESQVGSGTFVSNSLAPRPGGQAQISKPSTATRRLSRRSEFFPQFQELPWRYGWGAFGVHQPALDQFPFEVWARLVTHHSREPRMNAIHYVDPMGLQPFRQALCDYLRTARAVRCEPHQIMVVSGSQQALEITTRVLLDPGDKVWIENPGYLLARSVLRGAGCELVPVPVDEDGMDIGAGIRSCRKARAAFVAPSHQYPLGATMSASRRLQLLDWAQHSGSWIIEDDYDSEYRYERPPIPSLQGLDADSRVIYIGTFSKVLFASIRLGYIVVPSDLIERFTAVRFAMDIFPSYLFQEVITDFMRNGHFGRHLRRMRSLYNERRTLLIEGLHEAFGDRLGLHGADAGMHVTVTLPEGYRDTEIATLAAKEKLWLWPLSSSYVDTPARQGFVLGFGSTPTEQIPAAIAKLKKVMQLS
jgi:GntR family transcriptional regulator / MocR family aminotransferase